jgi:nitroreductase
MEILEAIAKRRSVRAYTDRPVERSIVTKLIKAAIQAPSAMNRQPWAFGVVEGREPLARYSEAARVQYLQELGSTPEDEGMRKHLEAPGFNMYYNASTLIIILSRTAEGSQGEEDCSLAAQNVMLAACAEGLATCAIGFARPWLNSPEGRRQAGIPDGYTAVFPIIVGYASDEVPPVPRKAPDMLFWR